MLATPDNLLATHAVFIKQQKQCQRLNEPKPGCIVAFIMRAPFVTHMGIVLDSMRFIHIMHKRSVAIERLDNPVWKKRIAGFYEYKHPTD